MSPPDIAMELARYEQALIDGPRLRPSWFKLPPELRFRILDLVAQDCKDKSLSSYATVCPEWQYAIEKINFRRLQINNRDLHDFGSIMTRHNTFRTYNIRHLGFVIGLPSYSCLSCHKLENRHEIHRNNTIFTTAIKKLLTILSTWDSEEPGLTLELGIKSPSDIQHYYNDVTLSKTYPFRSRNDLDTLWDIIPFHTAMKNKDHLELRPEHFETARLASSSLPPRLSTFYSCPKIPNTYSIYPLPSIFSSSPYESVDQHHQSWHYY